MKRFGLLLGLALLGGCQTVADDGGFSASRVSGTDARGLAQQACSQCHAVEGSGLSRNPAAPTFAEVANRRGTSLASLTNWLRNAHNYPEEMDFALTDDEEGELASYIYGLRDENNASPIR